METWEYATVYVCSTCQGAGYNAPWVQGTLDDDRLREYGAAVWELVTVIHCTEVFSGQELGVGLQYVFKRPR